MAEEDPSFISDGLGFRVPFKGSLYFTGLGFRV